MAYKKKSKSGRKGVAQITLTYALGQSGQFGGTRQNGNCYIDIAKGLSEVNRKLYRQGMCYYVHSQKLMNVNAASADPSSGSLEVNVLPNSWLISNSWVKAFSAWTQMRKQVLEDNPSIKARWSDFKVFFNTTHMAFINAGTSYPSPITSVTGTVNEFTSDEWAYSQFTQPDHTVGGTANEYFGHMLGLNNGAAVPITWQN